MEDRTHQDNKNKELTIQKETSTVRIHPQSYENTFGWEAIQLSKPDDLVLVNVNRIYWKFSDLLQKMRHEECSILEAVMLDIKNEKIRYTPMRAGDILKCFSDDGGNLPKCTFVQYSQEA